MFFSPELLSKRDSGFGLLWLAATLGSKSSFKKLPRRSIQTADISQLCGLISHPSEPLALRLSSNLMVGVARVYKIKHEIFVTDVNNCFVHLRKAVQELHALGAPPEAQLQMGQPSVRPDSLTLTADPTIAVTFEFDAFAEWADLSGVGTQRQKTNEDEDEDEFTPGGIKSKQKAKAKPKMSLIPSETARADLYTLDEHHEHLLSTSFDENGSFLAGVDPSSSQINTALRLGSYLFDDNLFHDDFDMGLGDIGDELALELGEGWGATALSSSIDLKQQPNFQMGDDFDMGIDQAFDDLNEPEMTDSAKANARKRPFAESDKENQPPVLNGGPLLIQHSILTHHSQTAGPRSFAEELIVNDTQADVPELVENQPVQGTQTSRKQKKVRALLDARTELTDEELRAAREHYVQLQKAIRLEAERKKLEKEGDKALEDLIWGVPESLAAPALTNFWSEIYRIQVESRSGNIRLDERGIAFPFSLLHYGHKDILSDSEVERPAKRQKKVSQTFQDPHGPQDQAHDSFGLADNYEPIDYDFGMMDGDFNAPVNFDDEARIRSSEEPERGRDAGPNTSAHLGFDAMAYNPSSGTQRSAFFPWDNAAGTSSSAGAGFAPIGEKGSDRVSLDNADVRILRSRSRSGSRRGSVSIVPSQSGSFVGLNIGMSPGGQRDSAMGDDFQFDVTNDGITAQDTQEAENNVITLERTSYNFLEYCKMQALSLPGDQSTLNFDDIVPPGTSARRVAAAAFHHCLVLATKGLITIRQNNSYGPLSIKIK